MFNLLKKNNSLNETLEVNQLKRKLDNDEDSVPHVLEKKLKKTKLIEENNDLVIENENNKLVSSISSDILRNTILFVNNMRKEGFKKINKKDEHEINVYNIQKEEIKPLAKNNNFGKINNITKKKN